MSTTFVKLFEVYKEMLNEVGDMKNIKPYSFIRPNHLKYQFVVEGDLEVTVNFMKWATEDLKYIKFPPAASIEKASAVYNIGYNIEGDDKQYMKPTAGMLFRILKTVLECIEDFMKSHSNIFITVFETSKISDENKIGQKLPLYIQLAYKNKPSGHRTGNVKFDGEEGIYIGPIYKDYPKNKID